MRPGSRPTQAYRKDTFDTGSGPDRGINTTDQEKEGEFMSLLSYLRQAREQILTQIALIGEMRRGSVIRQFLKIRLKGRSKSNPRWPLRLVDP